MVQFLFSCVLPVFRVTGSNAANTIPSEKRSSNKWKKSIEKCGPLKVLIDNTATEQKKKYVAFYFYNCFVSEVDGSTLWIHFCRWQHYPATLFLLYCCSNK